MSDVAFVLTLAPLNDTFLRKHLTIPRAPELLKLGRPSGLRVVPAKDNGFFDLRVLSRNHASLSVDASGRLLIRDLGLSNGTFINGEKISDARELRLGDQIDLGFDIEMTQLHKKISALVENWQVVPLTQKSELIYSVKNELQTDLFEQAVFGDVSGAPQKPPPSSGLYPHLHIRNASNLLATVAYLQLLVTASARDQQRLAVVEGWIKELDAKTRGEVNAVQSVLARLERAENECAQRVAETERLRLENEALRRDVELAQAEVARLRRREPRKAVAVQTDDDREMAEKLVSAEQEARRYRDGELAAKEEIKRLSFQLDVQRESELPVPRKAPQLGISTLGKAHWGLATTATVVLVSAWVGYTQR